MNHLKEKKLNVNTVAIFNILGPIILNGINFFTIPVFTRLLGTENYGLYTIYYTWVNTFTILVSLQASGTIGVANVRMEGKQKLEPCRFCWGVWLFSLEDFTSLQDFWQESAALACCSGSGKDEEKSGCR